MITLFLLLLAIIFPVVYGYWEGVTDAKKIALNGSLDSLHDSFHFNNALVRGFVLVALSIGFWRLLPFSWGFLPAYLLYAVSTFGYTFTTTLNRKRLLPKFYVSHSPKASKTDRFMISGSAALGLQPQTFSRLLHTVFLLAGILLLVAVLIYNYL